MSVIAKFRHLHIAPRKVRLVVDAVRGKKVEKAQTILSFMAKHSAVPVLKLLNSAIANAENNFQLNKSNLYIYKITVDEGPTLKRSHPQSRGRASEILKRTSHVTIVLEETPGSEGKKVVKSEKTDEETEKTKKSVKTKTTTNRSVKKTATVKTKAETKKVFRRKSI